MNMKDLLKERTRLNGTIATFPTQRTVTITPSLRQSCNNGIRRYDFSCFDKRTLNLLLTDSTSIVYGKTTMRNETHVDFLAYLENLIEDLEESGMEATADDFRECARRIRELT